VAVCGAGGTTLELAAMGVPAIVIPIAANQLAIAQVLKERQAAVVLQPSSAVTSNSIRNAIIDIWFNSARRCELARNGRQLVDGNGAKRAAQAMLQSN